MPHAHDTSKATERTPSAGTTAQTARNAALSKRAAARRRAAWRRQPRVSRLLAWLLSAVLGHTGLAWAQVPAGALPSGGKLMVGNAQVQQSSNLLIVNQGSARLGMDWQSFNIGSGATVEFRQPGADSIALNRVVGNSGSEIYGRLRANGQVFLTNPSGVLFAPGAQVDVGGLVASTLDLSQPDFAAGRYAFSGGGKGAVVNQGQLRASAGGYLALFGNRVDNQGDISVDSGSVVLASGRAATVSISGSGLISAVITPGETGSVSNSGSVLADGGVVRMSAASAEGIAASLVNNSGLIRAHTIVERAGEIWITGDNVASSGQIVASAPSTGDGGRVMLIGDMQHGTTQVAGSIDASAASGRGGFVETSAASVTIADSARVTTMAPGGNAGTWLIDPTNFAVVAGGGALTTSSIGADTLSTNLGGGNVTIATAAAANSGDLGDISVGAPVSWSANKLTLNAHNNILVNAALNGSGTASLAFEYGNTSTYRIGAPVDLPAGVGSFTTKQGSNGGLITFTVVNDAAGLQGIDSLSRTGNYALGANIDLSSIANFNPIGVETTSTVSAANSFGGRFDGLGHTVSGLTTSGFASSGLFATTTGADIRNLTLSGGSVAGTGIAGAVAGVAGGSTSLTAVRSTTPVSTSGTGGTTAAGGLIGQSGSGAIRDSAVGSVGNPVAISGGAYTGGLVGNASTTTITDSSAAVTLTGAATRMGGLAGQAGGAVSASSATGTAQTSGNAYLGGLIGDSTAAVSNSTADVALTATNAGSYVGGLLGASTASVSSSSALGSVSGGARVGGLVGSYASNGNVSASSASGNVSSTVATADVGGLVGNASGTGSVSGSSASGTVTAAANADTVGGLAGEFSMTGGIVNSSAGAAAVGATAATAVSGGAYTGGVVGWYNSATALVNDASNTIAFRGASVSGVTWVGGLVGYMNSTAAITGPAARMTLTANVVATGTGGAAGGLAGRTNGAVSGYTATGTVTSAGSAGGLVGAANGAGGLSNVTATGAVTATGTAGAVGGLVGSYTNSGSLTGTVGLTTVSGAVQGGSGNGAVTGGLVGSFSSPGSIVDASTAVTSTVAGGGNTGGLVGDATGPAPAVGAPGAAITGSTARGTVTGGNNVGKIGGLVGDFNMPGGWSSVTAEGTVAGGSYAGGLAGDYRSTAPITGGTFTGGTVSGGTWVGGLFGSISSAASITGPSAASPMTVAVTVTSASNAGGLAGFTGGTVTNVRSTGSVTSTGTGNAYVGGLIGQANGTGGVTDVAATGTVTTSTTGGRVGGLIGYVTGAGGSIVRGTSSGNVSGGLYTGGLVGVFEAGAGNIQNASASGNVSGLGDAGGIVGSTTGTGGLASSTATGTVASSATTTYSVGGVAGYYALSGGITATSSAGNVSGGAQTGGAIGYYNTTTTLSGVSTTPAVTTVTGSTWVGGIVGYVNAAATLSGLTGTANVVATGTSGGAGGLAGRSNGSVTGSSASGTVTGKEDVGGLIGYAQGTGTMSNVSASGSVTNTSTTGAAYVGGLVGRYALSGAITGTATATGVVSGGSSAGGFVGFYNSAAAISGLTRGTAGVTGRDYVGGVVGYSEAASISGSSSAATVTATGTGAGAAGGLAGRSNGSVSTSSATGNVSGLYTLGGLVGYAEGTGTLSDSSATGSVTSSTALAWIGGLVGRYALSGSISGAVSASGTVAGGSSAGGVIGYYNSAAPISALTHGTASVSGQDWVGGLIGYSEASSITGSSSASNVTSTSVSYAAGGLVGRTGGSVSTSSASGNVTAAGDAGGLIGRAEGTGALTDVSATGSVTSTGTSARVGGLAGIVTSGAVLRGTASGAVNGGNETGGLIGNYTDPAGIQSSSTAITSTVSGLSSVGGLVGSANSAGGYTDVTARGSVTGQTNGSVGGLIGYTSAGNITRGLANGTVTAGSVTGGLVGGYYASSGTIDDSRATGNVSGNSSAGGLVGDGRGTYNNVQASGSVSGSSYVGGLIGQLSSGGAVTTALATGNVTASGSFAGGLIGYWVNSPSITDSRATGHVVGTAGADYLGGLVGYAFTSSATAAITNSSAAGNVSGGQYAGGLVGLAYDTQIVRGTATGNVTTSRDGFVYVGGLVGQFQNYYYSSNHISNSSATGSVFVDASGSRAGGLVGYFTASSITASTASGSVTARDSLNANNTSHQIGGLVGDFSGTSIADSAASGPVSGGYYAGGLAGQYNGSSPLSNSSATGNVTGTQYVGGLVGYHTNAGITNGFASGQVTSTISGGYTGGLVGYANVYAAGNLAGINDSRATGNVSGGNRVGGLIGYFQDSNSAAGTSSGVTNSRASGNVSGSGIAGGLVGYYNGSYASVTNGVSNSSAGGNVEGNQQVGGLVGLHQQYGGVRDSFATGNVVGLGSTSDKSLGGLVGEFQTSNTTAGAGVLTRSYATGAVSLTSSLTLSSNTDIYAGGLVGTLRGSSNSAVALTDSYATGAVTVNAGSVGTLRAGGLVGQTLGSIERAYSTGAVAATGGGTRTVGGLLAVRNTSSTVTNSHWATDTSGQASSAGGTASTLAALQSAATFTGWDLASASGTTQVWRIYEGQTTPLLRNFLTPLSLTLADISKVYDGTTSLGSAAITVNGTAVANPGRIRVSGVSANAGTRGLTASNLYSVQDGYDLSVTGTANLTISQRPLTLGGLVANKVYDGTTSATLAATPQFGGLVSGEDLVFQPGTGFGVQFASKTVGTAKTVNIAGSYTLANGTNGLAANYLLPSGTTTSANITPATLTAGSFSATNRTYDGTTSVAVSATSATLTGVMPGDAVGVDLSSVNSGTMANRHAGTAKPVTVTGVALSGADVGNYVLAGLDTVTVNIAPKTLTVNGITATDRQYNQSVNVSVSTVASSLSGLESGDSVQLRSSGVQGTVANKNVANGKAVSVTGLALRGPEAANYTPQAGSVGVNITPRVVNSYIFGTTGTNRVYDGTTAATILFYNDYTGYSTTLGSGDDATISTASISYDTKDVAYNTSGGVISKSITATGFSLSGNDAYNYTLANATYTTPGTISPKPLTVSGVTASNRVYNGTRDVAVTISGATVDTTAVVAGDLVSVATPGSGAITGQTADKNVGNAKAVTVPGLTLAGRDAGNYTITSGSGGGVTVNITKKDLTAVYTAANKVYDGDFYATIDVTYSGLVGGDSVFSYVDRQICGNNACGRAYFTDGSAANTQSRHVGTAKSVVINSNFLYTGADISNYTLVNPNGTSVADITPKPVNLAYSSVSKVYDGTTGATANLNFNVSGLFSGDTLTSTHTAAYTGATAKNAGTSKPIGVSGISLSGAHAGNYTVGNTTATTTGSVTAKPVTITGITATDRAYDGTTAVAVTAAAVTSTGFVPGDTVAVALPPAGLSAGTIANKNVGTNKPVTVTGLSLSGIDAPNYSIDTSGSGITVNISQAGLTPTYTGVSQVYNGGVTANVISTTSGIASGDTVTFNQQAIYTGASARDAGTGKPISVSNISLGGSAAANYTLLATAATTTGTITPKPVNPSYSGGSRVYNGLADVSAAVVGSSLQFVAGDSVGLTQTASFTGDGSAGVNKPVSISGITITGAQAANYSLVASTATTNATISPRPLGVTGITATNRVYDGTATVAVNVSGATVDTTTVLAGDVVTVTLPPSGISTGTLADRHVGNAKPVSITGLDLGGAAAANYALVGATGLTANITPMSLTAVWSGVNKVYDGTADAGVTGSSGAIFAADSGSLGFSAQGVFAAGKNVGSGKAVNVLGGFLTGASANDYALTNTTASTSADITPRTLTANYSGGSKVYDGNTVAVVTGTLSNRVAGDTVTATQTAQFTGASARNVGNGKPISVSSIALGGADAGNYTLANTTDTTNGTITPKPITVSGLTNVLATDRVYDGSRVVDVTVPVGVTLVPNSSDIIGSDSVTIVVPGSGVTTGTVANKNAGNGKAVAVDGLTLSGTDATNYSIAGTAGITVNIAPKPLVAAYSGVNKVYDGSTAINVTGASTDLLGSDSLLIRGNGVLTGTGAKDVGTDKPVNVTSASLAGTDAANYTLTNTTGITTVDVTRRLVTPSYVGGSRVYDGNTGAPVVSNTGNFITGDNITLSESAVFSGAGARNAGTGKAIQVSGITLGGTDAGNYNLTATVAGTTGTIQPKPLTLTGLTGITATDRNYDGSRLVTVNVASTGTIAINAADIVAGDTVDVVAPVSGVTTGTLVNKNAGTNRALVVDGLSLTGTDAANYTVAATNGVTVNIAPKPLNAVYTGVDRVYNGTAVATVTGASGDVEAGDTLTISGSGIFSAGKSAGTNLAIAVSAGSLGGTDATNYSLLNPTGNASATITPKVVTAVYAGGTRVYDGTTVAPVTGTLSGQIAGDSVSLAQGAVFTGVGARNVGVGKAVDVSGITLSGTDAANYSLSAGAASTTASITPKPLGILGLTGVTAADRTYDGTTTVAVTVSTSGTVTPNPADLIAGDVVTITAPATGTTTGSMTNKNVGTNKPVTVAGLTLGGTDAGNYSVASTSGVTVNIAPKSLTANYTGVNRTYDGTTAASAIGSSGDILGTDIVLINATGVFTGSGARNAALSKPIDLLSAALSGSDAPNYNLLNTTGSSTADITPLLVVASYSGGTRVYDSTTAAPVSRNVSGFLTGDAVSLSETAVFTGTDAKNVGTGKAVQVSAITLSGADAGNYALLSSSASTSGSITPRQLNVTGLSGLIAVDRVYDGTNTVQINGAGALGSASGNILPGDDVTVNLPGSVNSGTMADKHVGQNKAVVLGGLSLGGTDAPNYVLAGTAGLSVNITPLTLTSVYSGVNREYDGTTTATVLGTSGLIVVGDAVLINATGVFSGNGARNVGTAKPIDVTGAALSGVDAGNYLLASTSGSASADITARIVTPAYSGGSRVYDRTTAAPVTSTTGGFIAGDAVAIAGTATFTGAGAMNVGNGKPIDINSISLTGADAFNYALASTTVSTTGNITPRPLNVTGLTGITAVDRDYDGTRAVQVNLPGSLGNAGGDVIQGDVVSVNVPTTGLGGGTMVDKHAGQNKPVALNGLFLSGADAPNYAIAGTVGVTVNIAPLAVTLAGVSAVDRVYDGTTAVAINTASGSLTGVLPGDDLQLPASGVSGTMANKHVGQGKAVSVSGLNFSGADLANYTVASGSPLTVNIAQRALTPSVTAADKTYNGDTGASITLSDDRVAGDALSLGAGSALFASADAGNGLAVTVSGLAASGADAANYQLSTTSLSATATINRAPLAVTSVLTKVYGDTLTLTGTGTEFSAAGLVAGQTLGQVTLSSAGTAAAAPVATVPYAVSVGNATGGTFNPLNYAISYVDGQLAVTPRPLAVTANNLTKVYGDPLNLSGTEFSSSGLVLGETLGQVTLSSAGTVAAAPVAATPYALNVSNASGGTFNPQNYSISYLDGQLSVTPRPLTVAANNLNKVYGDTLNLSGTEFSTSGLVLGQSVGQVTLDSAGTAAAAPVTATPYAVNVGNASGGTFNPLNYSVSYAPGQLSVAPRPLSVTADNLSKIYGETPNLAGTEFSTSGLVMGETLGQVTLSSAGIAATAAVTTTPYALGAGSARGGTFNPLNYDIRYIDGRLTVTPRPLTVATGSLVRFAGESNPTGSFGLSTSAGSLVNGDTLVPGQTATPPAGSDGAAGVSVFSLLPTNVSFATGSPGNYTLSYSPGLLVVLPQPPLIGETDTGEGGTSGAGVGLLDDPVARSRAEDELGRVAVRAAPYTPTATLPARLRVLASEPLTPDQIGMLLSADGQRITQPELQRLPLITFDPQLRRRLQADAAR